MLKMTWKKAFFLLLAIDCLIVIVFIFLLHDSVSSPELPLKKENEQIVAKWSVQTSKNDLNRLVKQLIEKENKGNTFQYEVIFTDQVELYGTFPVFNQMVEMRLTFEPEALENGDLILKHRETSIGKLQVPVKFIMEILQDVYHFPEWIEFRPKEKLFMSIYKNCHYQEIYRFMRMKLI